MTEKSPAAYGEAAGDFLTCTEGLRRTVMYLVPEPAVIQVFVP